jgi:nicotinamidase-related amidase
VDAGEYARRIPYAELFEQGFDIAVVEDATASTSHPRWGDGYEAALINFNFLANAVMTTNEAVEAMKRGKK